MNTINARVKLLIGTEEEVRAGLIIRQKGYATDTKRWIIRVGVDTYDTIENYDGSAPGAKVLWRGFCDPSDVRPTIDNATRTYGFESISGNPVAYYCKGVLFSVPNGDARLKVTLPALSQVNALYFNDGGQYSYEVTENSDAVLRNNTLGEVIKIQSDGAGGWQEIASISRWDNCAANEIENYASYKTKIVQTTKDAVSFSGALGGSAVTHTGGTYFTSLDHEFDVAAQNPKTWATFFLNGLDSAGKNDIERTLNVGNSVPYYTTGGALQWSDLSGGTPVLTPAQNGRFVVCHLLLADGYLAKVTSAVGVGEYTNLSGAQTALQSERAVVRGSHAIFGTVQILASCIFKNNAGVGELQPVDGEGSLFDYVKVGEVSVANPSAVTPSYDDVLTQGARAQRFPYIDKTADEIAAEVAIDPKVQLNGEYLEKYGGGWTTLYDGIFDFVPAYTTGGTGRTCFPVVVADPVALISNCAELSGRLRITMEYNSGAVSQDIIDVRAVHKALGGPSGYSFEGVNALSGSFNNTAERSITEFGLISGADGTEERVGLYLSVPAPSAVVITNIRIESADARNMLLVKDIPAEWDFSAFDPAALNTQWSPLPAVAGRATDLSLLGDTTMPDTTNEDIDAAGDDQVVHKGYLTNRLTPPVVNAVPAYVSTVSNRSVKTRILRKYEVYFVVDSNVPADTEFLTLGGDSPNFGAISEGYGSVIGRSLGADKTYGVIFKSTGVRLSSTTTVLPAGTYFLYASFIE